MHVEEVRLGSTLRIVPDSSEIGLSSHGTDPDLAIFELPGEVLEAHRVHDLRRCPWDVWLSYSFTVAQFVRMRRTQKFVGILRGFRDLFTGPLELDPRRSLLARKAGVRHWLSLPRSPATLLVLAD